MTMKTVSKWTARIGIATIVAALLVLLAGPFIKFGVLPWQAGLLLFVIAALLAGLGGLYSLVMLIRRRGGVVTLLAAAAGLAALAIPAAIIAEGRNVPPINDITTDTANPPAFEAITAAMRGPGTAPLAYDPGFAAQQRAGYPDLKPLTVTDAPDVAFDEALGAAKSLGWAIIASDAGRGRIEATDTVPWWGFHDDIVIRLTPADGGTRIDVRSKSRVGKGDVGVNAKRIADFYAQVGKQ